MPLPAQNVSPSSTRWRTRCRGGGWVTSWSKTFQGKEQVVGQLFGGVEETLTSFSVDVHHIFADGERVVVEHTGHNTTPDGRRYDNNYCWVFSIRNGLIREVREYMDTQLVTEAFADDPS
jgi:ketosteroid isomerase-like protein